MNPGELALARRAVACPRWRYMDGMRVHEGIAEGWYRVPQGSATARALNETTHRREHRYPDLSDPATLGCLLALVREAWGDPEIYCTPRSALAPGEWLCIGGRAAGFVGASGPTEANALVAALEAA